jgi:hypothetical protein
MDAESSLRRAEVWFNLGNYTEAFNELENLPPEHRDSVEVMGLRCEVYRKLGEWRELESVAEGCLGTSIENIRFACHHAWALLKQGRGNEAKEALERMPYSCCPELLFTKACVHCSLSELESARRLIADAITFSIDSDAIKLRVLSEVELEAIWHDWNGE